MKTTGAETRRCMPLLLEDFKKNFGWSFFKILKTKQIPIIFQKHYI